MLKGTNFLKKISLYPETTINEAINVLNHNPFRIIFVVSKKKKFLGTVTDGDIRRSIAEGNNLRTNLSKILNSNSIYVTPKYKADDIKKIFLDFKILTIPCVKSGVLIGFYEIQDFISISKLNTTRVLLMAGGFGKRLLPLTKKIPKPMLLIKKKPILRHIIEKLSVEGFANITISTHYKSSIIMNYFKTGEKFNVNINYVNEEKPLGTAGCLAYLKKYKDIKSALIINGDIFTAVNFTNILNFHESNSADVTICIKDVAEKNDFGVVDNKGIIFNNIEEKPIYAKYINAGIYVFNYKILRFIKNNAKNDMVNLIKKLKKLKKKIIVYPITENWSDLGTLNAYKKIKNN